MPENENLKVKRYLLSSNTDYEELTENSMKAQPENKIHIIDIKNRCQGLVLSCSFKQIRNVQVKLISSELPDQIYYDLSGEELQMILQERYSPLADNLDFNAVIPFSLVGNLPLNDESFIQVKIELKVLASLYVDRIITSFDASNPIIAKTYNDVREFESNSYDEVFFVKGLADLGFLYNQKRVHLPQLLYHNASQIVGFASQKVMPETNYNFSAPVSFIAVEY